MRSSLLAFPACRRLVVVAVLALVACDGPLSALSPAGRDAERIASLFWSMTAGAAVIWLAVMGLALYALGSDRHDAERREVRWLVVGGGALFPTVVLSGLLIHGLRSLPELLEPGSDAGAAILVTGERWWWRVHYRMPAGEEFELANELYLPVGERVPVRLAAQDVIHAFWVPSLAGKMDMIPGRINRTALEPTRTGVFWGACTEYCGASHARMLFRVRVVERQAFETWAAQQARPAQEPVGEKAQRGKQLFLSLGCGACHTVRGTNADGIVGPDLTHVGSRLSLGAGILDNRPEDFRTWLTDLRQLKPHVNMPSFEMLSQPELTALSRYLDGLQ